jgi:hypothetical protein
VKKAFPEESLNNDYPVRIRKVKDKVFDLVKLRVQQIHSPFNPDIVLSPGFLGGKGQPEIDIIVSHPDIGQSLQVDDIIFDSYEFGHRSPLFSFLYVNKSKK